MLLNILRQSDNKIFLDPLNIFTDGIPRSLELLVNLCASPSRPPLLFSRVLLLLKMATYRIHSPPPLNFTSFSLTCSGDYLLSD